MPKYYNPRKTWEYSQDFKAKVVELSLLEGIRMKRCCSNSRHSPCDAVTTVKAVESIKTKNLIWVIKNLNKPN